MTTTQTAQVLPVQPSQPDPVLPTPIAPTLALLLLVAGMVAVEQNYHRLPVKLRRFIAKSRYFNGKLTGTHGKSTVRLGNPHGTPQPYHREPIAKPQSAVVSGDRFDNGRPGNIPPYQNTPKTERHQNGCFTPAGQSLPLVRCTEKGNTEEDHQLLQQLKAELEEIDCPDPYAADRLLLKRIRKARESGWSREKVINKVLGRTAYGNSRIASLEAYTAIVFRFGASWVVELVEAGHGAEAIVGIIFGTLRLESERSEFHSRMRAYIRGCLAMLKNGRSLDSEEFVRMIDRLDRFTAPLPRPKR